MAIVGLLDGMLSKTLWSCLDWFSRSCHCVVHVFHSEFHALISVVLRSSLVVSFTEQLYSLTNEGMLIRCVLALQFFDMRHEYRCQKLSNHCQNHSLTL